MAGPRRRRAKHTIPAINPHIFNFIRGPQGVGPMYQTKRPSPLIYSDLQNLISRSKRTDRDRPAFLASPLHACEGFFSTSSGSIGFSAVRWSTPACWSFCREGEASNLPSHRWILAEREEKENGAEKPDVSLDLG